MRIGLGVILAPRDLAIKGAFLTAAREHLTAAASSEATEVGGALSLDRVLTDIKQTSPTIE